MGLIYQISCNITSEKYIGSTKDMKRFIHRKSEHKCILNSCSSKQIINRGNYEITILEENNLQDIELNQREQEFIDRTENTINMKPAYINNEERILNRKITFKKHYETNKEKISLRKNKPFTCECGCNCTHSNRQRHFKSKKHMNYLLTHS